MEVNVGAETVSVADPLILLDVAVMVADPWMKVVARPPVFTVATDVAEEVQAAVLVRFWVVPLV